MKKILLYILLITMLFCGCVRELGEEFLIPRRVDGTNLITLNSAYLYGKADIDNVDSIEYYFDKIDSTTVHYAVLSSKLFSLDSIEILNVGYVYETDSAKATFSSGKKVLYGDTVLVADGDSLKFVAKILGLNMDELYYVRSFVIAKDLRSDRIDTGYNQTIIDFRTLIPEDFWIKKDNYYWGGNRQEAVSFVLDNKAYIHGGFDGLTIQNDTWRYNAENDSWEQVGTAGVSPQGRMSAVSFVIEDEAWIGMGIIDKVNDKIDSTFIYYTSSTNSWRQKYGEFPSPRKDAIAFTLQVGTNQRGFVGFGKNQYGIETGDLYMYLQEADTAGTVLTWTQVPINGQTPSARTGSTVAVIENRAFIMGGEDGGVYKNDFWMFDGVSQYPNGTWLKLQDFPGEARANSVSFSLEYTKQGLDYKAIYAGTGITASGLVNDFFKYDLGTTSWTEISYLGGPDYLGTPREGAVGFDVIKARDEFELNVFNRGYVVGGRTEENIAIKDVWEYFP